MGLFDSFDIGGAIAGGGAGFLAGGPIGAAVGAGLGSGVAQNLLGEVTGANKAAEAAQNIAEQKYYQTEKAVGLAQLTAGELAQRQMQLDNQQQQITFSANQLASLGSLLAQISPVLAQGYQMQMGSLSGQNAGPLAKQIDIERQQNLNRQVAGMGTGASSSSAGMAADALFGQQAGMARMQDAQQLGAMNAQNASVFAALAGAGQDIGKTNQSISSNISALMGGQQERLVNAQLGLASIAGAGSVGQLYQGQATQGMFNTALGAAAGAVTKKAIG